MAEKRPEGEGPPVTPTGDLSSSQPASQGSAPTYPSEFGGDVPTESAPEWDKPKVWPSGD